MRDPGIEEHIAFRREPVAAIEVECLHLSVEQHGFESTLARRCQHRREQRVAGALPSPFAQDCDPSDMPVGQQTSGADRHTVSRRERMQRNRIRFIPLEILGHVLLDDENGATHRSKGLARLIPRDESNLEAGSGSRHGRRL